MALYTNEERLNDLRQIVRNRPQEFAETFCIKPSKSSSACAEKPWDDEGAFRNQTQRNFWLYATAKDSKFKASDVLLDRPTEQEIKARLNCFKGLLKTGSKRAEQMARVKRLQVLIGGALGTRKKIFYYQLCMFIVVFNPLYFYFSSYATRPFVSSNFAIARHARLRTSCNDVDCKSWWKRCLLD